MAYTWAELLGLVAIVGWAGRRLALQAETLADLAGWSRSWLGLFALGTVTSLPELVAGISAVTLADAPDLAAGDALGSCVFNLALLGAALLARPHHMAMPPSVPAHRSAAVVALAGLAVVALGIGAARAGAGGQIGHVGIASVALALGYAWSAWHIGAKAPGAAARAQPRALRLALLAWIATAVVVVVAGARLPLAAAALARAMGWSDSFVGALLVALATSMPELASTWAAVRRGAVDLAWGNLLGSNLFDLLVLAVDDVADLRGPLLARVSVVHLSSVTAAALGTCVLLGLLRRPARAAAARAAGAVLVALYGLNAGLLYGLGAVG